MVLCSIGLELVAVLEEDLGNGVGIGSDLLGVGLERWVGGLLEGNGNTGDGLRISLVSAGRKGTYVVVGSTLTSREDGSVDPSLDIGLLVLSEEDETSSGTSQSLVGGGSDDITELERRALFTSSNKTRNMSHIGKEVSSLSIGNLPQSSVIPISGVSGSTTN
jgi:hypothetical protein